MESTGMPGQIQVSQKTADLLRALGKEGWLTQREDLVEAKGKGSLVTYWLKPSMVNTIASGTSSGTEQRDCSSKIITNDRKFNVITSSDNTSRLVDWNVGVFRDLLLRLLASRGTSASTNMDAPIREKVVEVEGHPIDEISEILEIPRLMRKHSVDHNVENHDLKLNDMVETQLRDFIRTVAHLYKSNPFHNFEHASHVVMSTMKLLDRIRNHQQNTKMYHEIENMNQTMSLYLDPLTEFGVVFAALIHDADHLGMSNQQLIQETIPIAQLYQNKSIAEQNSIDVAWHLFMQPTFDALRHCMFTTIHDLRRFRQVVVNSVLATDIFDKDLKTFRDIRWEQVFTHSSSSSINCHSSNNEMTLQRKNAIVIEHLMQASDVVHTMQHWKVYQKWNRRLFLETYVAYQQGHTAHNPSHDWYDGELWFFDNYVLPLAKKLRTCGVFGVSSDEFFDYAVDNRAEWEKKGKDIVVGWEQEIIMNTTKW
jgi:3'5'-cyclic nucleotide phosphodiesterase/Adenylate and Guanylate cyclase catalytic domain